MKVSQEKKRKQTQHREKNEELFCLDISAKSIQI